MLKVHIRSNHLESTTLSLLQTKLAEKNIVSKKQCTSSFQKSNNCVLLGASKSTQRYRVRERKWQTRETLARGLYPPYTPLHTNGKEINRTTSNIKGLHTRCINLEKEGFLPSWIQNLLNILLNNKSG